MDRASPSLLDNFWLRMAGMFGHTWVSQYGVSPIGFGGDTWAVALGGLTGSQVKDGINGCLAAGLDWPPSAPRFRSMCFDIPSLSMVLVAARNRFEETPFMLFIWRNLLSRYAYDNSELIRADKLLKQAYEVAVEYVMNGGELPAAPVALIEKPIEKPSVPASPEVVKAHMDKIREMLHIEDPRDETP